MSSSHEWLLREACFQFACPCPCHDGVEGPHLSTCAFAEDDEHEEGDMSEQELRARVAELEAALEIAHAHLRDAYRQGWRSDVTEAVVDAALGTERSERGEGEP